MTLSLPLFYFTLLLLMSEPPSCVICLTEYFFPLNNDDLLSHTNTCSHSFHFNCIKIWSQTSNSCPICRAHFTEISATETPGGPVVKRESIETRTQASSNTDFGFGDLDDITHCTVCGGSHDENVLLLCDMCDEAFHTYCVNLTSVPEGDWYCSSCKDIRQAVPELNGRPSSATRSRRDRVAQSARRNTRTSRAAANQVPSVARQQRNSVFNRLRNDMRRERAEEAMIRVMNSISTRETEPSGTKRNVDDINVDDTNVHDFRRNLLMDRRFESSTSSTPRSTTARSVVKSSSSTPSAVADVDRAWQAFERARKSAGQTSVDTAARANSTRQRPRLRPGLSNRQQSARPLTSAVPLSSTLVGTTTNSIATSRKNRLSTMSETNNSHHEKTRNAEERRSLATRTSKVGETDNVTNPWRSYETPRSNLLPASVGTTTNTIATSSKALLLPPRTTHPFSSRTQSPSINSIASPATIAHTSRFKVTPSTHAPRMNSISPVPSATGSPEHHSVRIKQNVSLPSNITHQEKTHNTEETRSLTTRTSKVGESDNHPWRSYKNSESTLLPPSVGTTTNPIATSRKNHLSTLSEKHHSHREQTRNTEERRSLATRTSKVGETDNVANHPWRSCENPESLEHHHSPVRRRQTVAMPGSISSESSKRNNVHQWKTNNTEEMRHLATSSSETDDVANSWKSYKNANRQNSRHFSQHHK